MADQLQQGPLVRVKKADGSFEMVPLSQVGKKKAAGPTLVSSKSAPQKSRKRKKPTIIPTKLPQKIRKKPTIIPAVVKKATETTSKSTHQLPAVKQEQHLATTAPVPDAFVDIAKAKKKRKRKPKKQTNEKKKSVKSVAVPEFKPSAPAKNKVQWKDDDHKSLLEESFDEVLGTYTPPGGTNNEAAERIIKQLTPEIQKTYGSKLGPIILSRLKDVRTEEQVHTQLTKPVDQGGLGMESGMAAQVIATVAMVGIEEPAEQEKPKQQAAPGQKKQMPIPAGRDIPYSFPKKSSTRQTSGTKAPMHDVVQTEPPAPLPTQTQGPVDIFGNMTLQELRLRHTDVSRAFADVQGEIQDLLKESYLVYEKAVTVWKQSPIMREYQKIIMESLNSRLSVEQVIHGENIAFTSQEFVAMVQLNQSLG